MPKKYYCEYCDITFKKKSNYDRHTDTTGVHKDKVKEHEEVEKEFWNTKVEFCDVPDPIIIPKIVNRQGYYDRINEMLKQYKLYEINLNEHFNFTYYNVKLDNLNNIDLIDFEKELESCKHLLGSDFITYQNQLGSLIMNPIEVLNKGV